MTSEPRKVTLNARPTLPSPIRSCAREGLAPETRRSRAILNMCLDQLKEDVQLPGNHSNDSAHRKTDAKNNDAMNLISPVATNFESSMEHKIAGVCL